jgi:hypothetical protein
MLMWHNENAEKYLSGSLLYRRYRYELWMTSFKKKKQSCANGASLLHPLYYVWSAKPNPSPETAGSRRHNLGQARGVEAAGVKWKRYILPVNYR